MVVQFLARSALQFVSLGITGIASSSQIEEDEDRKHIEVHA
jgi:hypothetical protein